MSKKEPLFLVRGEDLAVAIFVIPLGLSFGSGLVLLAWQVIIWAKTDGWHSFTPSEVFARLGWHPVISEMGWVGIDHWANSQIEAGAAWQWLALWVPMSLICGFVAAAGLLVFAFTPSVKR